MNTPEYNALLERLEHRNRLRQHELNRPKLVRLTRADYEADIAADEDAITAIQTLLNHGAELEWCHEICTSIYYANIVGNHEAIQSAVGIVAQKWHVSEGREYQSQLDQYRAALRDLWGHVPEHEGVAFEECGQEMFLLEFPEHKELIASLDSPSEGKQ